MLNVAAPGKFVLTLQSIPPFLIECILAFALAVLLAVPLIARLQLIFTNRHVCVKSSNPMSIPTRRLHRHNRHIITQYPSPMITTSRSNQNLHLNSMHVNKLYYNVQQSIQTLTSVPFINRSLDRNEEETKVENGKNEKNEENEQVGNYMIFGDNSMKNIANFEYQHYRHKLIKENFKKNYGHLQAPGNFVLNSIHLSYMDSQKGIDDKCNNPLFVSNVASSNVNDVAHKNISLKSIDHRDLFLTKKSNDKLETVDKIVGTEQSSIEINQSSELINMKEHANPSTELRRKSRAVSPLIGKDKSSNNNTDNDHAAKNRIDIVETDLRPNTPKKDRKLLIRSRTRSSPSKPIKSADTEILNAINSLPISMETANKYSDIIGETQIQSDKLKDFSYRAEVPEIITNERIENSPSNVTSVIGKCSSMASSEAFSTCSSKYPERRPINTKLGLSSGGGVRGSGSSKHPVPKVKSRPKSSGASFAWEVPDLPHKVSSCEIPAAKKIISHRKKPKSPSIPVNKKKSEVLSVLESIMDLSCEAAIDFQESTIEMDIQNFREMYDKAELTRNVFRQVEECSRAISVTNKKTRLPISSSNQKRTNLNPKSMGENKETKPYLRSRSGIYNKLPSSNESRN
ncbi:hypothetical protein PV326_012930 [Microctonus aethiopoides]|nr:hypothetical protein PV326_012930 [Microctonus aethiopoides]